MKETANTPVDKSTRRQFMQTSATLAAAGTLAFPITAHAAGSDLLKVALIGCGGRGTGAARQALLADQNVKLTVMADAFDDRLQSSLKTLSLHEQVGNKVDVPPEQQFVGFDAYKQVLATDVDVVLLTTPPQFRPIHLKAASEAGKHVFAEKPVAVDAPGVRSVLASCEEAKRKQLSVVSGLCLRYDGGFRETVKRIHDGAIGDVHTLMANDYRGPIWGEAATAGLDRHALADAKLVLLHVALGRLQCRTARALSRCLRMDYGRLPDQSNRHGWTASQNGRHVRHIYDHHSVTYEYENGSRIFSNTRQQPGCKNNSTAKVHGSKGAAEVSERRLEIAAGSTWRFRDKVKNMYEVEHDELFAGIRKGQPLNNGEYMAKSTLLAIMGRMATYTGKEVTWEQALNSKLDLSPEKYAWGSAPEVQIAMPGITKLT